MQTCSGGIYSATLSITTRPPLFRCTRPRDFIKTKCITMSCAKHLLIFSICAMYFRCMHSHPSICLGLRLRKSGMHITVGIYNYYSFPKMTYYVSSGKLKLYSLTHSQRLLQHVEICNNVRISWTFKNHCKVFNWSFVMTKCMQFTGKTLIKWNIN